MIQFAKLRLNGFKSFVERTEMEIGPGLTGVVGPNGCGKSNLVEALRWSMGESSSKRMRGGSGSMEDVIFAGTGNRPARNMAEVSVLLDNSARTAPVPHNNLDEIEVVRRIERDRGSSYRINGKNARARDVQLLYADILSGANSPYLVSQGRITTMIQAKPLERRMLLEEAAGISGLYARRHEAELRLRATDNNLKRLEDIVGSMETRLADLKKQARQAARYRTLSAQIRQLEVMIACMEWRASHEKLKEVERKFAEIESVVAEHMTVVTQLTKTQTTQSKDLPDLRQQEAEMSAALQAQKLALQRLEDEEQRLENQIHDTKAQLSQLQTDRAHEKETLAENSHVLERMDKEEASLSARQEREEQEFEQYAAAKDEQQNSVAEKESTYTTLMEEAAADRARKQALEQKLVQDEARLAQINERFSTVQERLAEKKADQKKNSPVEALRESIAAGEKEAERLQKEIDRAEEALKAARTAKEDARESLQAAVKNKDKLSSEISALDSIVNIDSEDGFKPVLDDIQTDEGFETALSRALGDTLMASMDDGAPVMWLSGRSDSLTLPTLPRGVQALEPHVKAPAPLCRALSQIGIVEDEVQADTLWEQLAPGQSLVSRAGAYWRWDGLHITAEAADRHALQLKQKNRLAELQKQAPALEKECAQAETALENAQSKEENTQAQRTELQESLRALEQDTRQQRRELNESIEAQAAQQAELAKLEEALSIAALDLDALKETIAESKKNLKAFDQAKMDEQQESIETARTVLNQEREKLQEALLAFDVSQQEQNRRKARLQAIGDERVNLQNRCIRARERLKDFDTRETQLAGKLAGLQKRPAGIKEESEKLLTRITTQESEKAKVSDKLALIEGELAETTRALKEAENALGTARESRAHAQATAAERQRHLEEIKNHVEEHFGMSPEALHAEAALDPENLPDLDDLRARKEKDVRSRDMIGPVNLRADTEADELEKELTTILNERNDLMEAIEELRGGINKLNKEARERLQTAFDHVNAHFREMFTRLFDGGNAHLALIESDDPLEAGLEIYAQPPGKALQSLSLLSGGEQTLTAIALIFAMFLTNPAPICVLDEVDAPLDDANVDRVCDLLEEFADRGETRFILITHHRLTMARMDRLYGVTMSEKGVSQLVSVDLNQQFDFLEAA